MFYIPSVPKRIHLFSVNSNELHEIEAPVPNRTIVLQIPLKNFNGYLGVDDYIYFMRSKNGNDYAIMDRIRQMFEIYEKKEYGYNLAVNGLFSLMLYEMVTEYKIDESDRELLRAEQESEPSF